MAIGICLKCFLMLPILIDYQLFVIPISVMIPYRLLSVNAGVRQSATIVMQWASDATVGKLYFTAGCK